MSDYDPRDLSGYAGYGPLAAMGDQQGFIGAIARDQIPPPAVNPVLHNAYRQAVVESQLIKLWQTILMNVADQKVYACLAGLNVGDPVNCSAADDTATLAKSDTEAHSRVMGFCGYKPTTTTCLVYPFHLATGLTSLTRNGPVYLSDAGGYAGTQGTVLKVLGTAISATEAILWADPAWAQLVAQIPTLPVAINQGGTGQTTQQAALDALAGAVTDDMVLAGNGTHITLRALDAGDIPTLNQNTSGTAAGLSSTLAVGSGGTGQTTQQAALDALAGGVTNYKVLRGNGTHVTLDSLVAGDLPNVPITGGGTGQTTANTALNALLPTQTGHAAQMLGTDGTNTGWISAAGGADVPIRAVKASNEDRTSTSMADDGALAGVALVNGHKYKIKGLLKIKRDSSGGANFKLGWNFSGTGTLNINAQRGGSFYDWSGDIASFPSASNAIWCDATQYDVYVVEGLITVTTDGNLAVQWASNDGVQCTVAAGSFLEAVLLS